MLGWVICEATMQNIKANAVEDAEGILFIKLNESGRCNQDESGFGGR